MSSLISGPCASSVPSSSTCPPTLGLVEAPEPGSEVLDEDEARAVQMIVDHDIAWLPLADLVAAGHDQSTIERLVEKGFLVRWGRSDGVQVSLSPWGAWRLAVVVTEVLERHTFEETVEYDHRTKRVTTRSVIEVPQFRWRDREELTGDPVPIARTIAIHRAHPSRFLPLPEPELIVDPAPGPLEEVLMVEAFALNGDPLRDPETGLPLLMPLLLLGQTITVDRRLHGKAKAKAKAKGQSKGKAKGKAGDRGPRARPA